MGDHCEEFLSKLKEFSSLIRFASYRCQIPGVLDSDDLYQEGLMILDRMFHEDYPYLLDTDIDFRKMFKTELWHGLFKIIKRHKAQQRDFKKVVPQDYSELEKRSQLNGETPSLEDIPCFESFTGKFDPEETYILSMRRK